MNIGLYGGSFDPFHNGHLSIVKGALKSGMIDAVIIIPTARSSFKRGRILSAAPYRYAMVNEVVNSELTGLPVVVSDIELTYPGISYTAETVSRICDSEYMKSVLGDFLPKKKKSESFNYFWLCGSDLLHTFDQWYKPDMILSFVKLMVAQRPGDNEALLADEIARLESTYDTEIEQFLIDGCEAASSEIRVSGDYSNLPEAVQTFIKTHDMYSSEFNFMDYIDDETANNYYEFAISMMQDLGFKRLLHTLNVGILSCRYAVIHGADANKALIAGMLHDCAKELDLEKQREFAYKRSGDLFTDKKLLHSPAGAIWAEEKFGVTDPDILNAITYHTTGRFEMTLLDKIVFLADKLEPARTYTDLTQMRQTALVDLDEAVRMCVGAVKRKFETQGRDIHPMTKGFMDSLGI